MKTDSSCLHLIGRLYRAAFIPTAFVFVSSLIHTSNAGSSGQNINVTSNVNANCKFSGSTTPINFGAYDPTDANAANALDTTGSFQISCTKGTSVALTIDNGSNYLSNRRAIGQTITTTFLNYELYTTAGRSTVWDSSVGGTVQYVSPSAAKTTFTIHARIPGGQDVEVQNYSDTITVTSTF